MSSAFCADEQGRAEFPLAWQFRWSITPARSSSFALLCPERVVLSLVLSSDMATRRDLKLPWDLYVEHALGLAARGEARAEEDGEARAHQHNGSTHNLDNRQ